MTAADAESALWWNVQSFLHREADLLDEREYEAWLALLDDEIRYRAPIARNVKRDARASEYTGEGQIAWFDEGIDTLRQRVRQLATGYHWIEEPASRVSHLITNVRILEALPQVGAATRVTVRSRFLVHISRPLGETAWLVGKRQDVLRRATPDSDWKIVDREIHLDQSVLGTKAVSVFL